MMTIILILVAEQVSLYRDRSITATYTLSLHDALPIFSTLMMQSVLPFLPGDLFKIGIAWMTVRSLRSTSFGRRSEEHTPALQSPCNLVCRLLPDEKYHIN